VASVRIATWNVNSVKQRVPRLLPWLDERRPAAVCLQDHPDPAAGGRDRARLRAREPRRTGESHHHLTQTYTREDRDSIPRRLAVSCDGIPALSELLAEQLEERIVCELGLSVYAPNGRVPDSEHYRYKLAWLASFGGGRS
jgi:exodeoxyribonuclease-3